MGMRKRGHTKKEDFPPKRASGRRAKLCTIQNAKQNQERTRVICRWREKAGGWTKDAR